MLQLTSTFPPCPFYSGERRQVVLWYVLQDRVWQQAGCGTGAPLVFVGRNRLAALDTSCSAAEHGGQSLSAQRVPGLQTCGCCARLPCRQCLPQTGCVSYRRESSAGLRG